MAILKINTGIGITNPSYPLHVAGDGYFVGDVYATGSFIPSSDERIKTNIKTIDNALQKVLSLRGVEYDRTDLSDHQIGLIAQEVEKIIPEVVYPKESSNDEKLKSVSYLNLIGLLVEAIKELNQKIETLENKNI